MAVKSYKQNAINALDKEIKRLQEEENTLKQQLQILQTEIKDIQQALLSLQSSTVRVPLTTKIIDTIQAANCFISISQLVDTLASKDMYYDIKLLRKDVMTALSKMKSRMAVVSYMLKDVNYFGLIDWVNAKEEPDPAYLPKISQPAKIK